MKWTVYLVIAACFGGLIWHTKTLKADLALERVSHEATRKERDDWKSQALAARTSAEALAASARACLDREAQAQADAEERAIIMANMKARPRTEAEQAKVVDDETRSRVVERLNRGL